MRQAPDVIDAAIFGDKLHVLLRQGSPNAGGLQGVLERQGITTAPPRPIVPSLEDVFVQLVSRPHGGEARP